MVLSIPLLWVNRILKTQLLRRGNAMLVPESKWRDGERIADRARQPQHAHLSDAKPVGVIVGAVEDGILDDVFEKRVSRSGNDVPLLEFTSRNPDQLGMESGSLILLTCLVGPLRQDICVIIRYHRV